MSLMNFMRGGGDFDTQLREASPLLMAMGQQLQTPYNQRNPQAMQTGLAQMLALREQNNRKQAEADAGVDRARALATAGVPLQQGALIQQMEKAQPGSGFGALYDQMNRPQRQSPRYRVGDQLVDGDGNVIYSATAPEQAPGFRLASPEEAQRYGATAGQFGPDGRFYPISPPSGMSVESDGQGGFRFAQGPGVQQKPFTEGQSRDNVYVVRARGALDVLEPYADRLTSVVDRTLDYDPTGVLRGEFQNPDFQVARQASGEFLQAILRKDTGAAITSQEQDLYGNTYLPRPGDGPEVLQRKAEARRRAISAIEAGMSPAQMLAVERGLSSDGGSQGGDAASGGVALPDQPPPGVTPDQWEIIRNDADLSRTFGGSGPGNPNNPASEVPGPASQIIRSGQPAAPIQLARAFVGKTEDRDAPVLSAFFHKMTGDQIDPALTPWCAAFANAVLEASGEKGTGRLNARSFLEWGSPVEQPSEGDVVVLWRGSRDSWMGHVGFFAGYDDEGNVRVVGGNQDNSVSEKVYSADRILGFRRPPQLDGVQA